MASKSPPKPRPNKKPWPKVTREPASDAVSTIAHGFGSTWSQAELGDAFDIQALSVIGDLDPTGVRGVVKEVLSLFQNSLEPLLAKLEQLRTADLSRRDAARYADRWPTPLPSRRSPWVCETSEMA